MCILRENLKSLHNKENSTQSSQEKCWNGLLRVGSVLCKISSPLMRMILCAIVVWSVAKRCWLDDEILVWESLVWYQLMACLLTYKRNYFFYQATKVTRPPPSPSSRRETPAWSRRQKTRSQNPLRSRLWKEYVYLYRENYCFNGLDTFWNSDFKSCTQKSVWKFEHFPMSYKGLPCERMTTFDRSMILQKYIDLLFFQIYWLHD